MGGILFAPNCNGGFLRSPVCKTNLFWANVLKRCTGHYFSEKRCTFAIVLEILEKNTGVPRSGMLQVVEPSHRNVSKTLLNRSLTLL